MPAAQPIIAAAHTTLQDPQGIRWPASELVQYLNAGQREIATHRPDETAAGVVFTLAAGTQQTLPSNAAALIEVRRNATGARSAITQIERSLLDAAEPDWVSLTADTTIHFMTDVRQPRVFEVYPPAIAGRTVEAVFSLYPDDVPAPTAPGRLASTVAGDTALGAKFTNALLDYVLFRAWSKDAEFGGNQALAQARYAAFAQAVGIEGQARTAVAPTVGDQT